jgi:hypothetical protein
LDGQDSKVLSEGEGSPNAVKKLKVSLYALIDALFQGSIVAFINRYVTLPPRCAKEP